MLERLRAIFEHERTAGHVTYLRREPDSHDPDESYRAFARKSSLLLCLRCISTETTRRS